MAAVSGIYAISNQVTGKSYIGSSTNISARFRQHRFMLRNKSHCNTHLLNSWNKHGEDNFEFKVVEVVKEADLISREQYWIDRAGYYNILKIAERNFSGARKPRKKPRSRKGKKNPFYGKKHTDTAKNKIGKGQRNREVNEATRKRVSAEQKGSKNSRALLTEKKVRTIRAEFKARRCKAKDFIVDEAAKYEIAQSTMEKVVYRQNWRHVR